MNSKITSMYWLLLVALFSLPVFLSAQTTINLNDAPVQLIANQGNSAGTVNASGTQITINGNGWNALNIPQTIDANTILKFEFSSTQEGEEHAIGFSNSISSGVGVKGKRFKLYGTQNVPNTDAFSNFSYTGNGSFQTFFIPIGEFFTGDFQHIVFINDNDAAPNSGNSVFKDIELITLVGCAGAQSVNLNETAVELISNQGSSTGTVNGAGTQITINGNGWNTLNIPQTIDANTILKFEFSSTQEGEEHAIGFSNSISSGADVKGKRFKLYGTQNVPNTDAFSNFSYTGNGSFQTFFIPVGEFFTGGFQHIVFINDNDAAPNSGNSVFKNIQLIQSSGNCPVTVSFDTPIHNQTVAVGTDLLVDATASSNSGLISNVKLFLDNVLVRQENFAPFNWGLLSQTDAALANLTAGTYTLQLVATDNQGNTGQSTISINVGGGGVNPLNIDYAFNFAPQAVNTPAPFIEDIGQAYGTQSNGLSYGWVLASNNTPTSRTGFTRNRAADTEADLIRETLMHMDHPNTNGPVNWELEVPNGTYRVVITGGDLNNESIANNTHHLIKAEGTTVIDFMQGNGFGFRTGVATVTVNDGKLTIDGSDGINAKISAVAIQSMDVLQFPAVIGALPLDGATDVGLNTTISANFLSLTNISANGATSLDNSSLNNNTVKLYKLENGTATPVSVLINGTGGGDAINVSVTGGLEANTRYRYAINGAQDLAGATIFPFATEFITGANTDGGGDANGISFTNVGSQVSGYYSSLTMGPDGKLYGLRISGQIDRWNINANGTLSGQQTLNGLNNGFGGDNRLAIGLTFAPNSTANNLIAYVSHSSFTFSGGPSWDGKLSRLTGNNLQNHQEILTNLPRSVRDHLTNSIVFDPNNNNVLYFNQGSNSAGGAADGPWGNRPERILTAATLRLDLSLLPNNLPLNVQTTDNINVINNAPSNAITMSDGTYNPYANNSPLTIAGSGIRNPYDLVFHSNGQIYVPTNGTAGGSNSPASVQGVRRPNGDFYNGPKIPAVTGNSTQRDFLFRINPNDNNIGYFGHPNPLRGEYVLNSGAASTSAYPSNIQADANYSGFAFDFEFNKSPNGVIEYQSAGALQGAMIVCRFSNGDDLIVLYPDGPNGDVSTSITGITGFTGFDNPLDLVEDPNTGNIYVAEYGGSGSITLLRLGDSGIFTGNGINVSFGTPFDNQNFDENESIGVVVNASDSNGSISNVQLFLDNTLVRQENFAPYEWGTANSTSADPLLENLSEGTYTLKAIATDNQGNTTETSINITVGDANNSGITVSFAAPENNDVYNVGESLGVVVNATDLDGSISNVQLFLNNTLVRQENYAPYEWGTANSTSADPLLENLSEGTYTLKAVATDNQGNVRETGINFSVLAARIDESAIDVTITPNPAQDYVNITVQNYDDENVKYVISSLQGQIVLTGSINTNYSEATPVNVSHLQNGVYLIYLQSDNKHTAAQKMVIMKH